MKLVIAQMKHETNTFSPVPTPLARFAAGRPLPAEGRDVYEAFKGLQYLMGFAWPNFYFHATTTYNILRHNGVELGKQDFIGTP